MKSVQSIFIPIHNIHEGMFLDSAPVCGGAGSGTTTRHKGPLAKASESQPWNISASRIVEVDYFCVCCARFISLVPGDLKLWIPAHVAQGSWISSLGVSNFGWGWTSATGCPRLCEDQ